MRMTDRRLISSGSPFEPQIGFSRAVVIGRRVLVSGTAPIWPHGEVDPDPYVQAKRCLEIIAAALAAAQAGAQPSSRAGAWEFYIGPEWTDGKDYSFEAMFAEADRRLYAAKAAGRNRVA